MDLNYLSVFRGLIMAMTFSQLVACSNESNSKLSLSNSPTGAKTLVNVPWNPEILIDSVAEQLKVAITFDDSDPINLTRSGDQFSGNFDYVEPNTPFKLGVTWYINNVHLATMTKEIVFDPSNPIATFYAEDYTLLDSDGDLVSNLVEVGANSDPFDGTVWPDIAETSFEGGLEGTTGEKESIGFSGLYSEHAGAVNVNEANEDFGSMTFTIVRRGTTTLPINIEYETVNGTATDNLDFLYTTGSLNWPVGSNIDQTVEVELLTDASIEDEEYFFLKLRNKDNPEDTTIFENGSIAVGKIINSGGDVEFPTDNTSILSGWYDASTDRYGVSTNARVEIMPNGTYNAYRILKDCFIKSRHVIRGVRSAAFLKFWDSSLFVLDGGLYKVHQNEGALYFRRSRDAFNTFGLPDTPEPLQIKWDRVGNLGEISPVEGPECVD